MDSRLTMEYAVLPIGAQQCWTLHSRHNPAQVCAVMGASRGLPMSAQRKSNDVELLRQLMAAPAGTLVTVSAWAALAAGAVLALGWIVAVPLTITLIAVSVMAASAITALMNFYSIARKAGRPRSKSFLFAVRRTLRWLTLILP